MTTRTASCPDCNGTMHYRLGEYECENCGQRRHSPSEDEAQQQPHRSAPSGPAYQPGRTNGYVDGDVQRGTRQR